MSDEKRFYVYVLIDPRNREIFYVGKGSGKRRFQHEKDAKRGCRLNPRKTLRILDILNNAKRPVSKILFAHLSESKALRIERQIISQHKTTLTNMQPGQSTVADRCMVLLNRIKTFETWKQQFNPSIKDQNRYFGIVRDIKRIMDVSEVHAKAA